MNKKNKGNKAITLRCEDGIICEVMKGAFIGIDDKGEFRLVDDICDAYMGVETEMVEEARNFCDYFTGKIADGYPRLFKAKKELTAKLMCVLEKDEW